MQITVKAAKVAKTGTNKSGDWELIVITSEDGTDYTTFDKKAKHLTSGSVIDIGEPVIKEGKISFKEFTVISSPPVSATPSKSNGYQMSKEEWAERNRIERQSIEAQTAVKAVLSYFSGIAEAEFNDNFRHLQDKALAWCEAKIDADMGKQPKRGDAPLKKTEPAPPKPTEGESHGKVEPDNSPIKNFGELWSRCKNYGIPKSEGLELAEKNDQSEIIDLDETWKMIFRKKFGA